jgi:hypothetical protein
VDDKCHCTDPIRDVIDAGVPLEFMPRPSTLIPIMIMPFESTKSFRTAGCPVQGCRDYTKNLFKKAADLTAIKIPGTEYLADCMCDAGPVYDSAAEAMAKNYTHPTATAMDYIVAMCSVPACHDYFKAQAGFKVMEGADPLPDVCKDAGAGDPRAENRPAGTAYALTHQMTLDGDVSTFDEAAFKEKAATLYRVKADAISVSVSAGSVKLVVEVKYESKEAATIARGTLGATNYETLGALLGVKVLSAWALIYADRGPFLSCGGCDACMELCRLSGLSIALLSSFGLVVCIFLCICFRRRRARRNRKGEGESKTAKTTSTQETASASV